ncbi:MAG: hypothetical protein OSB66_10345 [SAR202 cluster bacterium]|nr:hypothetical protein [SAR202 cluster bacterium]
MAAIAVLLDEDDLPAGRKAELILQIIDKNVEPFGRRLVVKKGPQMMF